MNGDALEVHESRDFRAYHDFLRTARQYMESTLVADAYRAYRERVPEGAPETVESTEAALDDVPEFQLYAWLYRNLQRLKYLWPERGIVPTVERQRAEIERLLDEAAAASGEHLRLDPDLELPDYYRMVDFHQHPGGVHSDPLDGVVYEIARRTTVAQHVDPNSIYRALFDSLPEGRRYERVLDWGTGHGAALIEWQRRHPESECHGVDLSAPCLKLANLRGREAGMTLHLSQQDFEHLDYPDGHFDLVFHMFMLHEIPPARHPAVLAEVHRVLKPGGLFAGAEFHLEAGDPFQNAIQRSHAWLNNETYSVPWYDVDYGGLAKEVGFSNVDIRPFTALIGSLKRPRARGRTTWNTYIFEK